jgi:NCAIR mutase (PurE)-related protein
MTLGSVIDFDALWQTIWTAAAAGIGVIFVYSIAVLGAGRSLDMRGERRGAAAAIYVLLALVGGAGTLAAIVWGIVLITSK